MTRDNAWNMNEPYRPIKNTYAEIKIKGSYHGIQSVLYEPVELDEKSHVAVLLMHSDEDFLSHPGGAELAKRGYRAICANTSNRNNPLDEKLLNVKEVIEYLRQQPGVSKVVTLGHSGGATLMSAYQAVAENGAQVFQGAEKLIRCADLGDLPPADGVMLLDSNYGNGVMTLVSLDPAVTSEDNGLKLDPELDLFNPANGYDPQGSTYVASFIAKYQQAQAERNNRLIAAAVERLHAIENGRGNYADDEPFIVPAGAQNGFNNKLLPQAPWLFSRTKRAWPLLHADGSISEQVIPCVRREKNPPPYSSSYRWGAIKSTVRTFLNSSAVRTAPGFCYDEDSLNGVEWSSSFNCTPGNMVDVSAPLLVMGMTGGYEFLAAEIIYEKATRISDKTIAFVEGATHGYSTATDCEQYPGEFGDTMTTLFNYVNGWLSQPDRFI